MMQDIQVIDNAQMSLIESVDIQGIAITMQKITSMQAVVQKTLKREHDFGSRNRTHALRRRIPEETCSR